MDFLLPALGEGIDAATVVGVFVKPGDAVEAGQNVLAVETDKATVDVPAESAGTVAAVAVKPGDKIAVGAVVLTLSGAATKASARPAAVVPPPTVVPQGADAPRSPVVPPAGKVEVLLPTLGEGIDAATVVQVMVKAGDTVAPNQTLLAVETDKATVEVPSEVGGTVESVAVKPGDKVAVGGLVLTLSGGATVAPAKPAAALPTQPVKAPPTADGMTTASGPAKNGVPAPAAPTGPKKIVAAGPATRRLARELGTTLADMAGTGRGGRVTLDDVKGFVRTRLTQPTPAKAGSVTGSIADVFTHPPLPDFSKFGEVEKRPVSNLRRKIAENLTIAVRLMPTVTQNDLADITDLEAGRKRIVDGLAKGTPKITWTVLTVKAVVAVLKEFPHFNSSYDMNAGELHVKKYFHIGIAVDTERGLVVPVIKNADGKSIRDIAAEVASIADKARTGKLAIDDMRGGTFTITNLGGIGGTSFTPIVNYPEVAILGISRSVLQPVVKDGAIVPRLMMPLSLTYDHRVIDGADGARFTTRLVQLFSDPIRLLMES